MAALMRYAADGHNALAPAAGAPFSTFQAVAVAGSRATTAVRSIKELTFAQINVLLQLESAGDIEKQVCTAAMHAAQPACQFVGSCAYVCCVCTPCWCVTYRSGRSTMCGQALL